MLSSSIIIPTRNRPSFLLRCVRSALAAQPPNSEIIVVDDASEIPASDVLSEQEFINVRIVRNDIPTGYGGSPARNRGVQNSFGQVLFFLDDDDEVRPDYFREIISTAVPQGAGFGFAARSFLKHDPGGPAAPRIENRGLSNGFVSSRHRFASCTFPFSAGFWIKRCAYDVIGPFSELLSTNSDTEYCCRLYSSSFQGWFSVEPGVVIIAHNDDDQSESKNVTALAKSVSRAAAFRSIAEIHQNFLDFDDSASEFIYARWIKHSVRAELYDDATHALSRVSQRNVWAKLIIIYWAHRVAKFFR